MLWRWVGYTVTCAVSHQLLSKLYTDTCSPSWFGFEVTPFCGLLHKALQVLRAAPLLAVPILPQLHG